MFSSPEWTRTLKQALWICLAVISCVSVGMSQSQSNAADLQGFVRDPNGAAVKGATVTARNLATNVTRDTTTNDDGAYQIISLPPGEYEVTAEAAGFSKGRIASVTLTVGQRADLDVPLALGDIGAVVNIAAQDVGLIEKTSNTVANTIEQRRINDLPINERSATGFALTISTVGRDNGRPIGPAPTSGLNIGGQRGRSTLVQVDGADYTDNSVNTSRLTVSQEAVQEYQIATNSYAPEFGRATGGIINVVTKGGTNEFRGNVFGFLRHKSIQARNAFAPLIDNDPSKKPPFTRGQYGVTFGGPIKKNRSFFFTSFEQRRRQESGFFTSDVAAGLNNSLTFPITGLGTQTFQNLTAAQANFIGTELATAAATADAARGQRAVVYAYFASTGGQIGLTGASTLRSPGNCPTVLAPGTIIGARFFQTCAPVPSLGNNGVLPGFSTVDSAGRPVAFRALNNLARIFPISEATSFFSFRADHQFNERHSMTLRFGYNPSDLTGIQDESQNQTVGQNDFSRTGIQKLRDTSFAASVASTLSNTVVNEARFAFGRRKATFDSAVPGTAIQVIGSAFMGSNPFSPVNRTEKRFQFADNLNLIHGDHTFKFGGDINFIDVSAEFQLNFPGLFNFGGVSPGTLKLFLDGAAATPACSGTPAPAYCTPPELIPVQSYGLGVPSVYIQGFGNPHSAIKNKPLALFAQDSWKIRKNLTFNYGVRYDVELTETIAPVALTDPLTGIALSAADLQAGQDALGVQQGFPRDTNNFAPRVGFAWDVNGSGKTVLRGAYGIFYDHPLLAIAFNSDIADAAQQQQYFNVLPGNPAPNQLLNPLQIFQGTVCSQATTNPLCASLPAGFTTPGVARSAQYLPGRVRFNDQTFVGFGPVFPFTLAVDKNFQYAYANQANVTVERQLTKDMSLSASYIFVGAHHLPHPEDINAPRGDLLIENFRRFAGRNPVSSSEAVALGLQFPTVCPGPGCPPGFTLIIPGFVGRNALGQGVVNPIAANFFRPNNPNYFFLASFGVTKAQFDGALAAVPTVRTTGPITPFGEVDAQLSDGNSNYNALNLELRRRFADNFQFLASYTWSHSIDDSSDLQTLLKPQDNRNFAAERADSLFDQRHRFVFSGALSSPVSWRGASSAAHRFFADFTIAPILEISSGRPFNILSGSDSNGDLQSSNDRPSVAADGTTLFIPTTAFTPGNLGRNSGITHGYASLDLRVMRAIHLGERMRLDVIAEGFNLFNRFNEAAVSPDFRDVNAFAQRAGNGRYYSRPTAAYDQRQFQFGLKLNF
jgi:hypothetical protein